MSRTEDLAFLCCIQLFSRGLLEDVLRIWSAKMSSMDLGVTTDVRLLCGAGLAETKAFLFARGTEDAARALAYVETCEAAGDFEDFSVATQMAQYRAYFGVPAEEVARHDRTALGRVRSPRAFAAPRGGHRHDMRERRGPHREEHADHRVRCHGSIAAWRPISEHGRDTL